LVRLNCKICGKPVEKNSLISDVCIACQVKEIKFEREQNIKRPLLEPKLLEDVQMQIKGMLNKRLAEKGCHIWLSSDEILGIITREYFEYADEVKRHGTYEGKRHELLDIAVACIVGLASMESGKMHWV
jgi:hypothetical protein